jgi:hypothetical protein
VGIAQKCSRSGAGVLKTMKKYYIQSGGGYGDHIDNYYTARTWRALEKLKQDTPDLFIRAILYSANSAVLDFYSYHPFIDEIRFFDIHNDNAGNYRLSEFTEDFMPLANSDLVKEYDRDSLPMPKVYLSPEEKKQLPSLQVEPYICVNPFAGAKERFTLDSTHIINLIDRLIEEAGYSVLLLGGDWKTTSVYSTFANRMEEEMKERLDYERPALVNLIGKTSIRLATELSIGCHGFFGNYTGAVHPAWIYQRKTYCCVSPAVGRMGPHDLAPYTWNAWPLMFSLPFSKMSILDGKTTQDMIVDDAIKWFSRK